MGSVSSLEFNLPNSNSMEFFGIQMDHSDKLRLVLAPQYITDLTVETISKTWNIQRVNCHNGFAEIKLEGFPWHMRGEEDLQVKYFICSLLQKYAEIGWHLRTSSDLNKSDNDTSVLFFEKGEPVQNPSIICLSLNGWDKLRVLAPENVNNILRAAISSCWPDGVQREQPLDIGYEFKLSHNPWSWERKDTPILMNEILMALFANGWNLLGGIDTAKRHTGLNALYFQFSLNKYSEEEKAMSKFFSISLKGSDRMRLHRASPEVIQLFRATLSQMWYKGLQSDNEQSEYFAHEFKLSGWPWNSFGEDAVESRILVNNIFNLLAKYGWELYGTFDISKSDSKKSTFFFRSAAPKDLYNFVISLNSWDKMRVINGNQPVIDSVRNGLNEVWRGGINKERDYYRSHQFKLNGYPFTTVMSNEKVEFVATMLMILQRLKSLGYKVISSADLSSNHDKDHNSSDLNSFFLSN